MIFLFENSWQHVFGCQQNICTNSRHAMMQQTLTKVQQRDKTLDIAKGICIILMVIGHSGCPTYLYDFIYMFHMPCFFFISGWLLSDKYLSNLKRGLYQKAKGSYYPFVKWTLIFLLFHNVFASMHIYENYYSWQTFMERIIRTFTMTGSESLLGGFWFLISLFWASIISLLFFHMLSKNETLTKNSISGGGNFNSYNSNALALYTYCITTNVWGADFISNSVLHERLSWP